MFHELRKESVLARVKARLLEGHGNRARPLRMEQDLILWTRGGGIQSRLGAAYPKAQAESMGGSEARRGQVPGGLGVKASEWGKFLREVGPQSLSVKAVGLGNLGGRSPSWRHLELSKTGEVAANMERVGEDEKGYWLVAE